MNKQKVVYLSSGIYSGIKRNEVLICARTEMNLENTVLGKDTKGHILHGSIYMKYPK